MAIYVLRVKPSVKFDRIAPAGARILAALDQATTVLRTDLMIACGTEGHPVSDPHTSGEAYDVSVANLATPQILQLVGYLRQRLGELFYLQYETPRAGTDAALVAIAVINPDATAPHLHVQRKRGTVYPPSPAGALNA